jgi:hypothetical protein
MAVYVYSIADKEHPLQLDGVNGVGDPPSPLRTVNAGSLTAVVSDAPEDLRPKRRDLTAHQEVQNQLMMDGTVLPLRFGLTAPDDDAVRTVLEERAAEYTERLRALADCAEYHLKVKQDEEALLREILEESMARQAPIRLLHSANSSPRRCRRARRRWPRVSSRRSVPSAGTQCPPSRPARTSSACPFWWLRTRRSSSSPRS